MKKVYTLAITSILLAACGGSIFNTKTITGSGMETTKNIPVSDLSSIDIQVPVNAEIQFTAGTPSIQLSGYKNLLDKIDAIFAENKLIILFKEENLNIATDKAVKLNIQVPSLETIKLSSAAKCITNGSWNEPQIHCDLSGASTIAIEQIDAENLHINASGASIISLHNGNINTGNFDLSGASKIKAGSILFKDVVIDASGASHISVGATQKIIADMSGASNLTYKGNPVIEQDLSGVSKISKE